MKVNSTFKCCLFVIATLMLSVATLASSTASSNEPNRVSIHNHMERGFRTSGRLTFMAGAGFSIINSDNAIAGERNIFKILDRKGYGANVGIGAIYQLTPYVGVSGNIEYISLNGSIEGSEKQVKKYSFHTTGITTTGSIVVNIASKAALAGLYGKSFQKGIKIIPYVKAGVGAISFKASSYINNSEESERADYPKTALIVPVSGGLRFKFSQELSVAPEFTFNFTSTDHLDNKIISFGLTGPNDNYITTTIKLMYTPRIRSAVSLKM